MRLSRAGLVKAFTLTELLIVLVIIGILILMALPVLMPLISRTRSVEAKQMLTHLQSLEKTYFYEHAKYSSSLDEIGFEQEKLTTENGKANYRIEIIDASPGTFAARATSVVDFDGDGAFNVWEINQEQHLVEVTKD
ncbi:prepilin-type N-terminal cleavage/methylation domain-containing protein [Hymenobacter lucidus]|uniref:Type IV pilin protein n=1 Tax=Hymenobacter lucidus TaxID=2880930 RepID=A0ABS8AZD0_9BACT|nr:prepilin-type N-terminal cleavage/methylation domain-containing protein [Hymenobacter lucidus]MCB2411153.1 type IV pilin protein [Hymenobacter lucidus]